MTVLFRFFSPCPPLSCSLFCCLISDQPSLYKICSLGTSTYSGAASRLFAPLWLRRPCCCWAGDVSSHLFRRALGRHRWARNSWTQSTYWSLLGYLGEADLVHILCSGRKLSLPTVSFPLIFHLTLRRSPGCHGDQCSHFSFLSASFTQAPSLSLSFFALNFTSQSISVAPALRPLVSRSHFSSHLRTDCLLRTLIIQLANFKSLCTVHQLL